MDNFNYYDIVEKALNLSEEDRILIIYRLMESLEEDIKKYTTSDANGVIVSQCVIIKTLMKMDEVERLLKQLHSLEERISVEEDIDNSTSLILR